MLIRNAVGAVCHNNKKTKNQKKTIQNVLRTAFHQSMSVAVVYNLDSQYSKTKGKNKSMLLLHAQKNQAFLRFWLAGGRALGPGAFLAGGPWALGPRPLALGPWDLGPGPQALGTWALVLWALGPCARSARSLALRAASTPRGCLYSARQLLLNEAASSQRGSAVPEGCTLKMF